MIADFDASLDEYGPSFYRHLFWESGMVGQVLYLEAEAAGVRATGIGCFYDDPVHDVLGPEGSRVSEPLPLHGRRRRSRTRASRPNPDTPGRADRPVRADARNGLVRLSPSRAC